MNERKSSPSTAGIGRPLSCWSNVLVTYLNISVLQYYLIQHVMGFGDDVPHKHMLVLRLIRLQI